MFLRKPTALKIATRELEEAQRTLLQHQSAAEYHAHMSAYYTETISRLQSFIDAQVDYTRREEV